MQIMTLTAKEQFTFNKGLMEHLGVKAGQRISIKKLPNGKLEIQALENKIDDETLFDILDNKLKTGKKFSLEEIDAAIAQGYVDAGMKGLE